MFYHIISLTLCSHLVNPLLLAGLATIYLDCIAHVFCVFTVLVKVHFPLCCSFGSNDISGTLLGRGLLHSL